MHASPDATVHGAFVPVRMGDRGLGSWHLGPGALQSIRQSQGLRRQSLHLFCAPAVLHLSSSTQALQSTSPCCLCVGFLLSTCPWPAKPPGSSLPSAPDLAPRPAGSTQKDCPFLAGACPLMHLLVTKAPEPLCLNSYAYLSLVPEKPCEGSC